MSWVTVAVTGGGIVATKLFGGGGKKTSETTNTPKYVDWFGDPWGAGSQPNRVLDTEKGTWAHPFKAGDPAAAGPSRLDALRESLLDQLNGQITGLNDPNADPYGGLNFSTPHVGAASHISATHAKASLINMLDQAFQAEPNANLREDVYSRAKSGANAGAEDSIRRLMDSARASGAGPNSPWVQQLSMEAREKAGQQSTQALTDFFDSYVTAALARRAAALGQNSETQTRVNMFNAGADNSASAFNAGADNSVRALQAQLSGDADKVRAQLGYNFASLRDSRQSNILDMLFKLTQPLKVGDTTNTVDSQSNSWATALSKGLADIFAAAEKSRAGGGADPVWV